SGVGTTMPDGSFHAPMMLGGGDYKAAVRPSARSSVTLSPLGGSFPVVHVPDGKTHVQGVRLQIRLDRLTIAGRVVGGDGEPPPDARVLVSPTAPDEQPHFFLWEDLPSAVSAADGSFSIGGLMVGSYAVQARGGDGAEVVLRDVQAGRRDL